MSNVVDEKVVGMQFDNQQFEAGVKTTMSTLDKLKEALKFPNSTDAIDEIQKHITSLNLNSFEKAADAVVEAAKNGPFLSRDDFRERTKCPQGVIDTLNELGLLGEIPESNQISLFDFGM